MRYADKINESEKKRYAYQQQIDVFTLADLFVTFVTDDILPNYQIPDNQQFRIQNVYQDKVDELLRKNEKVTKKLFEAFVVSTQSHTSEQVVSIAQIRELVKHAKLTLDES